MRKQSHITLRAMVRLKDPTEQFLNVPKYCCIVAVYQQSFGQKLQRAAAILVTSHLEKIKIKLHLNYFLI